jgi:hypothetical protein
MFSLPNGINFFFMHNGTLCKDKVEETFEVKVGDNLSDSFTFSYAISRKLESFLKAKEFLKSGKDFVKENSGFNTISFFADGNNVDSIITVFFKGKKEYYKAYFLENQGLIAFISSTLKLHLGKGHARQTRRNFHRHDANYSKHIRGYQDIKRRLLAY